MYFGYLSCFNIKVLYIFSTVIMVLNNEEGFQKQNIRYICDVGRSTKGKHKYGYIGIVFGTLYPTT